YSLVEALQNLLENAGVSIQCNSEVVRIDKQQGRVQGVDLADGWRIESSIVVFNGDSAALPGLRGDTEPADLQGRSMSGIVLLLGIRGRLSLQSHHTVYFSADYRNEFRQLFGTKGSPASFPEDPTVYVNMPT